MIRTTEVSVDTQGHCDVHDLTASLRQAIQRSGLREGQVLVFIPGSTAGVTTVEFEKGIVRDLQEFFESILPEGGHYHHHATWGDDNGASHLRAALLKPALPIPFRDGKPLLGEWQQLVLVDFDTEPRRRTVIFHLTGDS